MLRCALIAMFVIGSICWTVCAAEDVNKSAAKPAARPAATAQSPTSVGQFDAIDDIGILRFIYPKESFTSSDAKDGTNARRYQIGSAESHRAAVLARLMGKFTQPENVEMLAMVGVDTGSDAAASVATGTYALLLRIDKNGALQLITRSDNLQRRSPPFSTKFWRPALATDVDFDKQDDLIMSEGDAHSGNERYSIYKWDGKDFSPILDHPAQTLLDYYSHLDVAAHSGIENESGSAPQLEAAYDLFSNKLQSQQSIDSLRVRLQQAKGIEIDNLKVLIKGEGSALIRLQCHLVGSTLGARQFEGDYQVRRFNEQWYLDSERLKVVSAPAAPAAKQQ